MEHSQSMLGQTCSDLVRLVQASLCNLKRSTPRTVSSLMMSPDKGSPFNSRWEVEVGRHGKSKQTSSSHQLSLSYHMIGWNRDSPEDCRVCQGRPALLKDEPPRSASTAPASRAWNIILYFLVIYIETLFYWEQWLQYRLINSFHISICCLRSINLNDSREIHQFLFNFEIVILLSRTTGL